MGYGEEMVEMAVVSGERRDDGDEELQLLELSSSRRGKYLVARSREFKSGENMH